MDTEKEIQALVNEIYELYDLIAEQTNGDRAKFLKKLDMVREKAEHIASHIESK